MANAVLALLSRTEALSMLLGDAQVQAMAMRVDPILPALVVREGMSDDAERQVSVREADKAKFGKTVTIAWRDDEVSLRALRALLRLLPNSEQVHIFIGRHPDTTPPAMPPAPGAHDVRATRQEPLLNHDPFGAQLLEAAHRSHEPLTCTRGRTEALPKEDTIPRKSKRPAIML